jgi:hypothetical protein
MPLDMIPQKTLLRDFAEVSPDGQQLVVCDPRLAGGNTTNICTVFNGDLENEFPAYKDKIRPYVYAGVASDSHLEEQVIGQVSDDCPVFIPLI